MYTKNLLPPRLYTFHNPGNIPHEIHCSFFVKFFAIPRAEKPLLAMHSIDCAGRVARCHGHTPIHARAWRFHSYLPLCRCSSRHHHHHHHHRRRRRREARMCYGRPEDLDPERARVRCRAENGWMGGGSRVEVGILFSSMMVREEERSGCEKG